MSAKDQTEDKSDASKLEKHESEMADILEELKKDANAGKAIDRIIEGSTDLEEMQSKLILLIKKHLAEIEPKTDLLTGKKTKFNDEEVAHNITKFSHDLIKKHEDQDHDDIGENEASDGKYLLNKKAKMNIKKNY